MKKLIEHTYGTHIYMKMELDGRIEEIDVYVREDRWTYRTTGDNSPERRKQIMDAFCALY